MYQQRYKIIVGVTQMVAKLPPAYMQAWVDNTGTNNSFTMDEYNKDWKSYNIEVWALYESRLTLKIYANNFTCRNLSK